MKVRSVLGIVACLFFAATLPAQIITNVVPPLGGHGEVNYIKIFGGGFLPGGHLPTTLSVKFNGTASSAGPGSVVADNEIDIADVPATATSGFITVSVNGGSAATSPQRFTIVPTNMPYATNFSPSYGVSGSSVTISGVHFATASVSGVTFNGVAAASYFKNSDNMITVTAPAGTTGPLILQSSLGATHNFSTISNIFSPATNFFFPASITSFSPSSGRTGTNVILTGLNFIGCSGITLGGVTVSDFTISNNTTIRLSVPGGASSGKIVLSPPNGTLLGSATSGTDFKILPSISNITPGTGPTNTLVTVSGSGLNEKSPHPDVTVGGATVAASAFVTISPGTLSFNVPANAASGPIVITTTNGSVTSDQIFYLPPMITSITPTNGSFTTLVRIQGNNFTNASVAFNGVTASSVVTNNNNIGAIAPGGVQSGPITVTTPFGSTNSTQLFYVQPTITDFAPTHGIAGTLVTVNGNSFTNASSVSFNGTSTTNFFVTNNSTLGVVVPTNATTGKITVTAPGGIGQSAADFIIDTADLGISVTDMPDPVFVGSNLVYTILVTNAGPITALNVRLTNTLAGSVLLKSASTTAGTLATNSNPIIGTLGDLANQGSAKIILTVTPKAIGTINNIASVGSDSGDNNLANNFVTNTTTVWPLPFLSITNLMTNDLVRVSWPTQLSSFTLQSSTNLSTNAWILDTTSRSTSGTNVSVIETNVGVPRFYRLTN